MVWLVPFLAGMIAGHHWTSLGVWIGLAAIFFGYVEARVLCRHCPHYAESGFFLLNRVPGSVRTEFFRNYSEFARAWGRGQSDSRASSNP